MNLAINIIESAIAKWQPSHIICLFSGGYDSMIMSHIVNQLEFYNGDQLPVLTYAIDTHLSADGWHEYIKNVALKFDWEFEIYDNESGFFEFVEWVKLNGCPYSKLGHKRAYARLKDRGINGILKKYKGHWHDKILFLSGIRQAESQDRKKLTEPVQRRGQSNAIFANPLFYWSDRDCLDYRIENELPENPFYETVGGSGDCQCNWGDFISYAKLKIHSPKLASGNVALLHQLSNDLHGYGWDSSPAGQMSLFGDDDEFWLCQGCKRVKPKINQAQEDYLIDKGW